MQKFRYVSNEYTSNCLIEAVKAKINGRKAVKIYFCKPRIGGNAKLQMPHFMWEKNGKSYDFSDEDCNGHIPWYRYFLFKGRIREFPGDFARRYSKMRNKR